MKADVALLLSACLLSAWGLWACATEMPSEGGSPGGIEGGPGGIVAPAERAADSPPPPPPPTQPRFVRVPFTDRTQWDSDYPPPCRLPDIFACEAQRFAGGAAVRDLDGDGRDEVYLSLYEGDDLVLRFDPEAGPEGAWEELSVQGLGEVQESNGAAFADIDNDGDPDLLVGTLGGERFFLFVNNGRGGFEEGALARGAAQLDETWIHTTMSLCFGDVDLDGDLDLYTTEWRGPDMRRVGSRNSLLLNRGGGAIGSFEDRSDELGVDIVDVARRGAWGFTPQLSDLDGDRFPELLVAADFGSTRLFWSAGSVGAPAFVDGTVASGVGSEENGMGSALGDYDGDGDLDLFVSSIYGPGCADGGECTWGTSGNRLYRNEGDRRFAEVTDEAGVRDAGWAWGARFFDYDLDGDLDLVVANGFRGTPPETGYDSTNLRLFRNDGGRFVDVAEALGLVDTAQSRAVIPFDYDLDGDLDLLITHSMAPPLLFRNEASEGRSWLAVRPVGTRSNRDGMGAIVRVWPREEGPSMVQHAGNGCGYLGHDRGTPHFGLGEVEEVARVEVEWPASEQTQVFVGVAARQTLVVTEPE